MKFLGIEIIERRGTRIIERRLDDIDKARTTNYMTIIMLPIALGLDATVRS